jgi:predicted nucleic acid-binding protein
MERILVDNNALADLFVGEAAFEEGARELRRKFPFWVAPPLCRYEFGNVLRTYVRSGRQSEETAQTMLEKGLGMLSFCEEPDESVILKEAIASGLSFYDATYVACARLTGWKLYTRDKEILQNCPDVACHISDA